MHAKLSRLFSHVTLVLQRKPKPEEPNEIPPEPDTDQGIDDLRHDIEALDQYLRIQNLRRIEEARFRRMQQIRLVVGFAAFLGVAALSDSSLAHALGLEGSLQSLVGGVVGRILPILALGFVGKNIFNHIQNDPDAGRESIRVAISVVMLLGINGVWSWLQSNVR